MPFQPDADPAGLRRAGHHFHRREQLVSSTTVFAALQRFLEHPVSRVILSVAIVVSLVPHEWMHATDAWFVVLFGPEVLARSLLVFRRESLPVAPGQKQQVGWRTPDATETALLILDVIAVVSFLPVVASSLLGARWLRLFRLTRTVLLLRYWAPVVRDLWTVSWRPERRRQLFFVFGSLIVVCFTGAVLLDHITTDAGDDFDGDGVVGDEHDHAFLVRMWWAFRQVEDPGNLLASPHDTGTVIVSVFLTLVGLFVISFIIGIGTDVVIDLSQLSRHRAPGMRGHTVLVNSTTSGERLLRELLHEETKLLPRADVAGARWLTQLWRNLRTRRAFVVVGNEENRPDYLNEPEFAAVVYRPWGDDDDDTMMLRADVLSARRVVLLASEDDEQPDDNTIRSLLTIVEQLRTSDEKPRRVLAEIVNADNLPAAARAASRALEVHDTTVIPSEVLIARCVAAVCQRRGLAELLIQLLRSEGREIYAWERNGPNPTLSVCGGQAPLETLAQAGGAPSRAEHRVIPLGLVLAAQPGHPPEVKLNPGPVPLERIQAMIAIADHAARVDDLALGQAANPAKLPSAKFETQLVPEPPLTVRNLLVCGFRRATVDLLASLLVGAEPDARVLILVADDEGLARALDDFAAQAALVAQDLVASPGGQFVVDTDSSTVTWTGRADGRRATLELVVADWTSPRSLGALPGPLTNAIDFDLVLFSSDGSGESDARNTTGLMTVEALITKRPGAAWPRVVAEVDDVELAARLNDRYASMGRPELHVFSIDELRALVMFQSVVVPHFGAIYEALLSPTDHGLEPMRAHGGPASAPYRMLAETVRAHGKVLVAVECEGQVSFAEGFGGNDRVDLARARLWVLD